MLPLKNKPEAILPVHTMDKYKEIRLENVPKTLHRALQKEKEKCQYCWNLKVIIVMQVHIN